MFDPRDLARFSAKEFVLGLEGISDEQARRRLKKADGSVMNSASWTIAHVAAHWATVAALFDEADLPMEEIARYFGPDADPAPPPLQQALERFLEATQGMSDWITVDDDSMTRAVEYAGVSETTGQALVRVTLHTWFHIGEINAIHQMLGLPVIDFLEDRVTPAWQPAAAT